MDYTYTPGVTDTAALTGFWAFFAGIWILFLILLLVTFGLWLWALIDVVRRQFTNPSDKTLWLVLVIVSFVIHWVIPLPIIPIIYLIIGRKKGTIPGTAAK